MTAEPTGRPGPGRPRLVAGVMSGTSVDGVDVALVRLRGSGTALEWSVEAHHPLPFRADLRERLLAMGEADVVRMDDIALMHVRLAHAYADAIHEALRAAGRRAGDLDLVGCHGQTVRHLPGPRAFCGTDIRATLQLGSGPTLANLVGVPVVTDFRAADMALGGEGAPLVPYVDLVLLGDAAEHRAALNIGGIANVTALPAGRSADGVVAFDTGPGNMVSDALCRMHLGIPFDRSGDVARSGTPDEALLRELLAEGYFTRRPPKSTGREAFGEAYVADLVRRAAAGGLSAADQVATAAALTADSVAGALRAFVPVAVSRVLVSGGGVHNAAIMERMAAALPRVRFESTAAVGLDPDAKEAVAFAVLAHETASGVPAGMPSVTGARKAAILGSVSYPS